MSLSVVALVALFGLVVAYFVAQIKKAGPQRLSDRDLARGVVVRKSTRERPEPGWGGLGKKTTARGLDLRFDHDDDPQAEASYFADGAEARKGSSFANGVEVRLTASFETHHVHTSGHVFRVRVRGTEPVIGRSVKMKMHVFNDGSARCGRVENDEQARPAVGGWIEFESVELLKVGR